MSLSRYIRHRELSGEVQRTRVHRPSYFPPLISDFGERRVTWVANSPPRSAVLSTLELTPPCCLVLCLLMSLPQVLF
jgi:hypothetical protein